MIQQATQEKILHLVEAEISETVIAETVQVDGRTVHAATEKGSALRKPYKKRPSTVLTPQAKRFIREKVRDIPAGPGVRKRATILKRNGMKGSASTVQQFIAN